MSEKLDEIERSIREVEKSLRATELDTAIMGLEFKNKQARLDFESVLTANTRLRGASYDCPDSLTLRDYAVREFERRPELQKPSTKPNLTNEAASEPKGKQIDLNDISPAMTDAQLREAWAQIAKAAGIESGRRH